MALQFLIPIAFFLSAAFVAVNFIQYRRRRMELQMGHGNPHSLDARLERMEQAIDAMALEMERLAESQRFTAQLMSQGNEGTPSLGRGDRR